MADQSEVVVDLNVDLNPDEAETTEHFTDLDLGGTVTWKNHSKHCPHFEIVFEKGSPAKPGDKLTGTSKEPISIRMPEQTSKFFYRVLFKREDGTLCRKGTLRSVRICPGGGPC
jgi:hypothetical protein